MTESSFHPVPKPGVGRLIDSRLLGAIKRYIGRCEWPDGCAVTQDLAAHHIFGRGAGGRDDHPFWVAVLCHRHHNLGPENAHDSNWWGQEGKARILMHILRSRDTSTWVALLDLSREIGGRKAKKGGEFRSSGRAF